jgi:hypothetical protein
MGLYLTNPTADPRSIPQPYRCYAKPYTDLGPIEYLAGRARSARQVGQSRSEITKSAPLLVGWFVFKGEL